MKIAILGTRGIPNNHGGFEQFAEYLSVYLVKNGHEVSVYNSHVHPFQNEEWNGVRIIHCYDLEYRIGTAGQFIYDFNCIRDCRKRNFDIVLQCGYTSSSIWGWLLPKSSMIITNMDGLEWKRSKYSKLVRKFLKMAEKWAVDTSDYLVADSLGIKDYLKQEYAVDSKYIAYGADLFEEPNENILEKYELQKNSYDLLIARLEPENNIEVILDGVVASGFKRTFLVIGKHETRYGEYLRYKFENQPYIKFLGGIYNLKHLNNLRYYSNLYFHGHSVGGTNPSLLEAMASNSLIIANDNIFNRSVLEENAYYFKTSDDVAKLMSKQKNDNLELLNANHELIKSDLTWEFINSQYERYFLSVML